MKSLSPTHLAFLAWGDFHARSRFARPTIPEEKWGTTRSLNGNNTDNDDDDDDDSSGGGMF